MPRSRRPATLAALLIVAGACGAPPPAPSGEPSASPSPAAATARADLGPAMVVRTDLDDGVGWFIAAPGKPDERRPLGVPEGDVQLGPATADGSILLTMGQRAVSARVIGDELVPERVVDLGPGPSAVLVPGCLAPDGAMALADGETLRLTVVLPDGSTRPIDVAQSLGECAWLDEATLVISAEGDRLLAWQRGTGLVSDLGVQGRRPSSGGGLVSVIDRSGSHPIVVVRDAARAGAGDGSLGPERFRLAAMPDELITNAQLSPDGGWLTVTLEVGPEGGASRWLRFYRVTAAGAEPAGAVPLADRDQLTLLPATSGGR